LNNEESDQEGIQTRLTGITAPAISSALGISGPYATDIRAGRRIPHPRHWEKLARLVGFSTMGTLNSTMSVEETEKPLDEIIAGPGKKRILSERARILTRD
jgi:hypothetical protein